MQRWTLAAVCIVALFALGLSAPATQAGGENDPRLAVVASFGRGLNTAQQGNAENHAVLPKEIRVKASGVVNFMVAGFHHIVVYKPGTKVEDISAAGPPPFINDFENVYYTGIDPAAAPPEGVSNAVNRVESVSFKERGTYLVICNVAPHFADGMYGYVRVDR